MSVPEVQTAEYTHWSQHCSLYSSKTRSYLIKKELNHVEIMPGHPYFSAHILPRLGYSSIPILETAEGEIIQDTTDIIQFLEARHPEPRMQPQHPVMNALSWLIHMFGTEGLFKAAQHYRWSFLDDNLAFVLDDISRGAGQAKHKQSPDARKKAKEFAQYKLGRLAAIGVTPESIPAIESSTEELFDLLDEHFRNFPYILGGRPCIGDCGLMTALYAHLGRDPYPAALMKQRSPALFRWTETMNRAGIQDAEHPDVAPEYFQPDDLPETVIKVLEHISRDFAPELLATATAFEDWITNTNPRTGSIASIDSTPKLRQNLGMMEYQIRNTTIKREAWPDILLMHQHLIGLVEKMTAENRHAYSNLLRSVGGEMFLSVRTSRSLRREDYKTIIE